MSKYSEMPAESVEFSITTSPSYELLTAAELRQHLRLPDFGAADAQETAYLDSLIKACGNSIETTVRRPVRAQSRDLVLMRFPYENGYGNSYSYKGGYWWGYTSELGLVLDITPIRAVNSIQYWKDGVQETLPAADYQVVGTGEHINRRVEIYPAEGKTWPCADFQRDIIISVDCGWTQAALPEEFKHAARLIAGTWYRFRDEIVTGTIIAEVPRSAKHLLQQYERMFV